VESENFGPTLQWISTAANDLINPPMNHDRGRGRPANFRQRISASGIMRHMNRRTTANPKRRLRDAPVTERDRLALETLATKATYGGNPEHKKNHGDFKLSPPSRPRPDKSLCDGAGIFKRAEAEALLKEGIRRGLVSVQQ
jgi:hypothetical protein